MQLIKVSPFIPYQHSVDSVCSVYLPICIGTCTTEAFVPNNNPTILKAIVNQTKLDRILLVSWA